MSVLTLCAMPKITKRLVESIKPGAGDVFTWDDELRGFGVRVKPSGVRSYLVQYRNQHGRSKRLTVGAHGRLTAEEARREARLILAEVEKGRDPAEARQVAREASTLANLAERYVAEHVTTMKPRSAAEERRMIAKFILPALGSIKVADISLSDVSRLHYSLRRIPVQANRVIGCLSRLMTKAEKWGIRALGSNPCRHVDRNDERLRERYLSADELGQLGDVLVEAEQRATEMASVIAAIRLLVLTGCRLSEVLTLEWQHVDFASSCLRLPDSKTGAKTVHLNAPALAVLAGVQRQEGSRWVIAGAKPGRHLVNSRSPGGASGPRPALPTCACT